MNKALISTLILLCFTSTLIGQDNIIGRNNRTTELSLSASMDNISFEGIGINTGFLIEDFLFLGVDLGLDLDEIESLPSQELQLGVTIRASVLNQDDYFPISCDISGTFKKNNIKGDYLTNNDLIKSGTAYTIGLHIYRDFFINPSSSFRLGLIGRYISGSYTTEPETGLTSYEDRIFEKNIDYQYGLSAGISFVLTEKMLLSADLRASLNSEFHIIYGPSISISSINLPPADELSEEPEEE